MPDGTDPMDLPPDALVDVLFEDELTYRTMRRDHVDWTDPRRAPAIWRLAEAQTRFGSAQTS